MEHGSIDCLQAVQTFKSGANAVFPKAHELKRSTSTTMQCLIIAKAMEDLNFHHWTKSPHHRINLADLVLHAACMQETQASATVPVCRLKLMSRPIISWTLSQPESPHIQSNSESKECLNASMASGYCIFIRSCGHSWAEMLPLH